MVEFEKKLRPAITGKIEGIGSEKVFFIITDEGSYKNISKMIGNIDFKAATEILIDWLKEVINDKRIIAIGHRVVFGGHKYSHPQQITPDMLNELRRSSAIDPDHLPEQILLIDAISNLFPQHPQIACFDNFFHRSMPELFQRLPIPRHYFNQGIRRYGFHGLSCEYLMGALTEWDGKYVANSRVILAHLGNGSSITAVHEGKCVDTSMSLTPCSGLPMSSRSGDLDPGVIFYLAQHEGMNPEQIYKMMNHESGLKAISGTSGNLRDLIKLEQANKYASDAVNFFCYNARKWISSMAAAMGGINTLVFSGGVGQNIPEVRARICEQLGFLGISLDTEKNGANDHIISASNSDVLVRVIQTNEELVIAQHTYDVLSEKKVGNCEF